MADNKKYRKALRKINGIAKSCVYLEAHGGQLVVVGHDTNLNAKQWRQIAKVLKKASNG